MKNEFHVKMWEHFIKVKDLYDADFAKDDLMKGLYEAKATYEQACYHIDSIETLPRLLGDIGSFILGWCHGNEYIDSKLQTGELTIEEIMDALYVVLVLAEDQHE